MFCCRLDPLVSFTKLDLFDLGDYHLHHAFSIKQDRLKPGGYLIADLNAIIAVSVNGSVEILAGKPWLDAILTLFPFQTLIYVWVSVHIYAKAKEYPHIQCTYMLSIIVLYRECTGIWVS